MELLHACGQLFETGPQPRFVIQRIIRPDVAQEVVPVDQVHGEEPAVAVDLQALHPDEVGMVDL